MKRPKSSKNLSAKGKEQSQSFKHKKIQKKNTDDQTKHQNNNGCVSK